MAIFMRYGRIKGRIELTSFQWGVSRSIGTATPGSTSRENSAPKLGEINVTKRYDSSTPMLFLDAVAGRLDNKVIIEFTGTTGGKVEIVVKYELENVGLSHFFQSSSGDEPTESLSLNFSKITMTFTGLEPGSKEETVGYDLTQMKTV